MTIGKWQILWFNPFFWAKEDMGWREGLKVIGIGIEFPHFLFIHKWDNSELGKIYSWCITLGYLNIRKFR